MRISARFLLFFVFSFFLFIAFIKPSFAQIPSPINESAKALNTNPDVEKNLHNVTQSVMIETISAMICQITGKDFVNPHQKCLGVDPQTNKIGFVESGGGMIGTMGTLIGYTFIPPASSGSYVHYLSDNFGVSKKTYAAVPCKSAGIGFCGLQPVLKLWLFMRNMVYLIFVLVFILIGLGIMLRIHIDPRTVLTVQNQIPKIIVGIVLVTFSFSIGGLLVDTMYVSSYVLGSTISKAASDTKATEQKPIDDQKDFRKIITSENPFDAANNAYEGGAFQLVGDASKNITELINSIFFGPTGDEPFENRFGQVDVIGGILRGLVGVIIGAIAFLIIAIAVIFVLVRLWVILLFAYINILLDIIFAPFWFILGLLPGSPLGISAWFRDMLANLAVFPATVVMLMLANIMVHAFKQPDTRLFVPPLLGNPGNVEAVSGVIGLGFFFMLPSILTLMKSALKAPKLDLGPVFKPAAIGAGAVSRLPKRTFDALERNRYAGSAKGMERIYRWFGNPILDRPFREQHGTNTNQPDHSRRAIPGGGRSDGE